MYILFNVVCFHGVNIITPLSNYQGLYNRKISKGICLKTLHVYCEIWIAINTLSYYKGQHMDIPKKQAGPSYWHAAII